MSTTVIPPETATLRASASAPASAAEPAPGSSRRLKSNWLLGVGVRGFPGILPISDAKRLHTMGRLTGLSVTDSHLARAHDPPPRRSPPSPNPTSMREKGTQK